MPKSHKRHTTRPDGATIVFTFSKLQEYLAAFARGHLNLLIIVGEPGLAKSRSVREALGSGICWIEGNATAFGMYEKLYRHRNQFVVIDDVDSLYADKAGIRLLKCVCQTEEEKTVAWHSGSSSLERHEIPREFTTTSRVVIICNDWKTLNRNVAALQDRGHMLVFQPSAKEIHRQAGTWFHDPEIYTWIGMNLHRIPEPSFRHYVRARELKAAGMDWTAIIAANSHDSKMRLVADILANNQYSSTGDRVLAFIRKGGGCRATFFNHKRRIAATDKASIRYAAQSIA